MAKGKPVSVKIVEDIPVYLDGEQESISLKIAGTRSGRIRFDFGDDGEPFEIELDELVEALIYVDTSGVFARRVLVATGHVHSLDASS